jgi:DNA-binding MarR family transcriptional regulator
MSDKETKAEAKSETTTKDQSKEKAIRFLASQFELDTTALEVHILLSGVAQTIAEKIESYLSKQNITRGRFMTLALLFTAEDKRRKPSELAELAGVTRATMTGLIDSLEQNDLVCRTACAADGRAMDVELTSKGEKLIRKVMPAHFKLIEQIMSGVTEADRRSVATACKKINSNLERLKD